MRSANVPVNHAVPPPIPMAPSDVTLEGVQVDTMKLLGEIDTTISEIETKVTGEASGSPTATNRVEPMPVGAIGKAFEIRSHLQVVLDRLANIHGRL